MGERIRAGHGARLFFAFIFHAPADDGCGGSHIL